MEEMNNYDSCGDAYLSSSDCHLKVYSVWSPCRSQRVLSWLDLGEMVSQYRWVSRATNVHLNHSGDDLFSWLIIRKLFFVKKHEKKELK